MQSELIEVAEQQETRWPQVQEGLKSSVAGLVTAAEDAEITDATTAAVGADLAKAIRSLLKRVDDERRGFVGPLNDVVKRINAQFSVFSDALKDGQQMIDRKLLEYKRAEEERLRKEREAERARMEAARKAEEERLRKEREAERARMEAARKAEEERLRKEREEAEQAANEMAAEGAFEEAEELRQQAAAMVVQPEMFEPPPAPAVAKPTRGDFGGVASTKKVWAFEVVGFEQVPNAFKLLDEKAVREAIRTGVREIPGLRIFQETQLQVR
jgi:NADH dehydrogenase/NADH:ubiquinone oxidoreductase subunit G